MRSDAVGGRQPEDDVVDVVDGVDVVGAVDVVVVVVDGVGVVDVDVVVVGYVVVVDVVGEASAYVSHVPGAQSCGTEAVTTYRPGLDVGAMTSSGGPAARHAAAGSFVENPVSCPAVGPALDWEQWWDRSGRA